MCKTSLPIRSFLLQKTILISSSLLYVFNLFGQTAEIDSITYIKGINNAVSFYHRFIDPPTGLYNGSEYVDYAYSIKSGHPFFMSTNFNSGSIVYDGVLYDNIPLLYDVVKGEIVIKAGIYKLSLIKEKVSGFSVLNHKFVRLEENNSNQAVISTGFYDILYESEISLYKKQKKKIRDYSGFSESLKRYIVESDFYYFKKDRVFYPVNNRGSLLSLLQNKRKEVQQFIRKNKLIRLYKSFIFKRCVKPVYQ